MTKTKILALLRLFRFELPFTAGVCVILGEFLALGQIPAIAQIVLGFLGVFFISATSLILNDYFDIESDKINAPHRPLPAGLVTPQEVIALFLVVSALGFLSGALLSLPALGTLILAWVVGFLYNWRLKKTGLLGNLMVSFSVGLTFIFGGIAVQQPFDKAVWSFAVIVFLINLGEEIAADAMDVVGDQRAGSRSLPVLLGGEKALKISAAIFILVTLVSCLPFALGWIEWVYAFPILLMDAAILYSTIKLLDARIANRRKYIRVIYLSGLAAILMFILLKLVW